MKRLTLSLLTFSEVDGRRVQNESCFEDAGGRDEGEEEELEAVAGDKAGVSGWELVGGEVVVILWPLRGRG